MIAPLSAAADISELAKLILSIGISAACLVVISLGERSAARIAGGAAVYGAFWGIVGFPADWPWAVFAVTWLVMVAMLGLELYDLKIMASAAATGTPPAGHRHQRMLKHSDEQLLEDAIRLHRADPHGSVDAPSQTMWDLVEATPRWQAAGVTPQNATHWLEASRAGWQPGGTATTT